MESLRAAWRPLLWGGLLGLLVGGLNLLGFFEPYELDSLNLRFHLRGAREPSSPIVIVTIDEDSFDELNLPWPWPRSLHARFVEAVSPGRPAAIGFDVLFIEPSRFGPEDDNALAAAIERAGNVVLGAAFTVVKDQLFTKEDLNPPVKTIRDRAQGFGFVNLPTDHDAFVRSAELSRRYQDDLHPSFDLLLYRLAVKGGIPSKPLPKASRVLINYRGPARTFPVIPFYQVINGEVLPEVFAGKIVLVGATTPTLHDIFPTPFATQGMPGVEIHANVLETLFKGNTLIRLPRWVWLLATVAAGMLAVWLTTTTRPLLAAAILAEVGAGYAVAGFLAFVVFNLWFETIPGPLALVLGYGAAVVRNFIQEQREKRRLSRYFSPDVIKEILGAQEEAALGGSRRRITVLFSDIRGFTSISEKLAPEEVVELLREYLTSMTEVVFRHGGTVDKFMGDAIMALYNAPFSQDDHAAQAVRTALEFQEATRALSRRWEARCGTPLRNGVGINTGDAIVGTIGSEQRLEYTAVGDTVNLASRLESITKEFEVPIIISEFTHDAVKGLFPTRYLGEVTIRGKEIPVKIYAVGEENER
jgi:adenylate cyclase